MIRKSLAFLLTAGLFIASTDLLFAQTACSITPTTLNLTATSLDQALTDLSKQSGCLIQYDKKLVKPFRSPVVQGTLTPVAAVTQLVRGTGLEVHLVNNQLCVNQADQQAICLQAATLQAQLKQALKAQILPQQKTQVLYAGLVEVRTSVVTLAKKQGFVSAAEKASYQRTFAKAQQAVVGVK